VVVRGQPRCLLVPGAGAPPTHSKHYRRGVRPDRGCGACGRRGRLSWDSLTEVVNRQQAQRWARPPLSWSTAVSTSPRRTATEPRQAQTPGPATSVPWPMVWSAVARMPGRAQMHREVYTSWQIRCALSEAGACLRLAHGRALRSLSVWLGPRRIHHRRPWLLLLLLLRVIPVMVVPLPGLLAASCAAAATPWSICPGSRGLRCAALQVSQVAPREELWSGVAWGGVGCGGVGWGGVGARVRTKFSAVWDELRVLSRPQDGAGVSVTGAALRYNSTTRGRALRQPAPRRRGAVTTARHQVLPSQGAVPGSRPRRSRRLPPK
jgi:hypothetical protein